MKTLGERIIISRQNADLTQVDLANKIGVTKAMLSKYERNINIPKADIIANISSVLHVSADNLLNGTLIPYDTSLLEIVTPEEKKLLHMYRCLSQTNQIRIKERMATLSEVNQFVSTK